MTFRSSLIVVGLCLSACGADQSSIEKNSLQPAGAATFSLSADQQETFDRTCGICHGIPGTGAPAPQDHVAWAPRNAQGMEVLLDHTINGNGSMPPMGMCMECSQEEFVAFIQFMSGMECEE